MTQVQAAPHPARHRRSRLPPPSAYWKHAPRLAVVLIGIIAVRLHELVPHIGVLKPAFSTAVVGSGFLLARSKPAAIRSAVNSRVFRLVIAYFLWAALGVPFALWVGLAANQLVVFLPAIILLGSILLCAPTLKNLAALQAGFVGAAALSAVALFTIGRGERLELPGSYDTNDTAALLALAVPFALGLVFHGHGRQRWIGAGAAALLAAGVVGTSSRGGTLALLGGVTIFVLGLRGGRKFGMLAAALLGAVAIWTFSPPSFRDRITALAEGQQDYNETDYAGRKQIWARARIYIAENPLFGVGVGNFPVAEGELLTANGHHGKWSTTHNAYLQAAAEMGIPGGLLFISILVMTSLRALPYWRMRGRGPRARQRHRPELLASVGAFSMSSVFLSHAYFFVFFALIGFVELGARSLQAAGTLPAMQPILPPRKRGPNPAGAMRHPEPPRLRSPR